MKLRAVPASTIRGNHWTSLLASHYAAPTRDIDICIKRTENTLRNAEKRLKKLHEERDRILTENRHGAMTPDGRLVSAE